MNVRCWNCGNDQEVPLTEERERIKDIIVERLDSMARTYRATGFAYRYQVFSDAVELVRSFRL
jgi:hypothetical protein